MNSEPMLHLKSMDWAFANVNVKIDTGCPHTSFPMQKLGISDAEAYRMKLKDSNDASIMKSISFGVNDSKTKKDEDKKKFRSKRYMELNSISFRHIATGLSICDMDIGDFEVSVSYDRVGNILIGMDILKTLEVHMGTISTGETVLLACPRNNITNDYRQELNSMFDVRKVV